MHPALSIIAFTTLSGFGYGLAAMLGLGLLDPAATATKIAHVVALALIGGGLLASTLHLRNPQRAWRAFSQWRTSWLSREGVMALATFIPLVVSAYGAIFLDRYLLVPGIVGAAMAFVTVYCTAMIYASLKAVDAWHTWLTPAVYLAMSVGGGAVLATFFASFGAGDIVLSSMLAMALLAAAWAVKLAWIGRLRGLRRLSTPESATGLGRIGRVRLFESPHGNENYLTNEMGFRIARKHAVKLFRIAFLSGCLLPMFLLLATLLVGGAAAPMLAGVAALCHGVGVLVERWLFFAEARHSVMSYY